MARALLLTACLTATVSACYSQPQPACGFFCGPDNACPDGYHCGTGNRCQLDGTSGPCGDVDAAVPQDAPIGWDGIDYDADVELPFIVSTLPEPNATGVDPASTIMVQFSEPVLGVDGASFYAYSPGVSYPGTITTTDEIHWTITPQQPFPAATTISVIVTNAITDYSSHPLAATTMWQFTTQ